ncbi:MAG: hypothetical protein LUI10_13540 [Lachnospiraceae bacterium]|nr:hypothetical protein [Lachnospiraceae bacterium]
MKKIKRLAAVGLAAALGVLTLSGCGSANGYRVVDMTSANDSAENEEAGNASAGNNAGEKGEEAAGSESGSDTGDGATVTADSGTYGIGDKVTILGNFTDTGEYQYVEVQVNSVAVMQDKIEGLNEEAFQYIPDKFGVSEDGTITSEYSFVAVGISLHSDVDMEVGLAGFKLEAGYDSKECFYNSSPAESNNAKRSGYTKVSAGVENQVTIGFFADDNMLKNDEFTLLPIAVYTGDDSYPKIIIGNPIT